MVKIVCKKCNKNLVEALPGSKVYCPSCRAWTTSNVVSGGPVRPAEADAKASGPEQK